MSKILINLDFYICFVSNNQVSNFILLIYYANFALLSNKWHSGSDIIDKNFSM